jgi:flagellar biosynthesis chaperone FliJ
MTIDRRTVRTLRDVRGKLRDLALAEHTATSASQQRRHEAMSAARTGLESSLGAATTALGTASTVADLDRISQTVAAHHVCLDEASAEWAAAVVRTEEASRQLRRSAQQVKTAERIFDRYQQESARRVNRQEQRRHDDLRRRGVRETKR